MKHIGHDIYLDCIRLITIDVQSRRHAQGGGHPVLFPPCPEWWEKASLSWRDAISFNSTQQWAWLCSFPSHGQDQRVDVSDSFRDHAGWSYQPSRTPRCSSSSTGRCDSYTDGTRDPGSFAGFAHHQYWDGGGANGPEDIPSLTVNCNNELFLLSAILEHLSSSAVVILHAQWSNESL